MFLLIYSVTEAAGRMELAHGPDFGHPWSRALRETGLQILDMNIFKEISKLIVGKKNSLSILVTQQLDNKKRENKTCFSQYMFIWVIHNDH